MVVIIIKIVSKKKTDHYMLWLKNPVKSTLS